MQLKSCIIIGADGSKMIENKYPQVTATISK